MIALLLAPWLLLHAEAAEPDVIERAYQKEYAYLIAERDALAERLQAFEAGQRARLDAARAEVDGVQGRLLAAQRRAAELEAQLDAADRRHASEAAGLDALGNVLGQASASLGLTPPAEDARVEDQLAALARALQTADHRLREAGRLTVTEGTFFLADGTQVQGRIARAGGVAAWGLASEGGGALIPVGGGRLGVFAGSSPSQARAIVEGTPPPTVALFLYESEAQRAEAPEAPTWAELVEDGGAIGLVILALGGVLTGLALWRAVAIARAGGTRTELLDHVAHLLREGRVREAQEAARRAGGAVGRVLTTLLTRTSDDRDDLEVLAERAIEREARALERFGAAMLVMASVAPLLGLLGTVSGMIATFDVITAFGAGDPKLLSGGISEALVTTQFGLVVAIPGVLVGNLLDGRAREILGAVETAALLVLHEGARPARMAGDDVVAPRVGARRIGA